MEVYEWVTELELSPFETTVTVMYVGLENGKEMWKKYKVYI